MEQEKKLSNNYQEVLNNYYKLKYEYEKKYNINKKKILNNNLLSTKEKKDEIISLKNKIKCINCSRVGGHYYGRL